MMNKKQKLKILLIEDNPLFKKSFETLLARHFVEHAESLDQFFAQNLKGKDFDLIFLDLSHSKDTSGESTVQAIPFLKSIFSETEIIVQSSTTRVELMKRSVALGARQFISKDHLQTEVPRILGEIEYFSEF